MRGSSTVMLRTCVFLDLIMINYQMCSGLIMIKIFNSLLDKKKKSG